MFRLKFILVFILNLLPGSLACFFLPWWSIAVLAFLVSLLFYQKPAHAFLSAFIAVFLAWFLMSLWVSWENNFILAHKLSLLILKSGHSLLLMLLTGFLGGLVAGMSSLTASLVRKSGPVI